jgi:ABC-type nitrate/sulfonate/bicarbonate transport system substrate-binding protein
VPGYLHTYFWVRAGDIENPAGLKGKIIGVNARGANTDVAAQIVLRRLGMMADKDYQIAEIRFPAQLPALESKRIDAAVLVPPFNVMAEQKGAFKPLFSVGDAFGPVETLMWMAKADWVAKNRAALVDFLEDNLRLRRWIYDPKTRPDAIKLLSAVTKIPAKAYEGWVFTERDYYSRPNGQVDIERLQKNVNDMKAAGMFATAIDVVPYVDMSLVREAGSRLAPK